MMSSTEQQQQVPEPQVQEPRDWFAQRLARNTFTNSELAGNRSGTQEDDRIEVSGGNMRVDGLGGRDMIIGNAGNDMLSGDGGSDQIFGNGGDDVLQGGDGSDRLLGGIGNDILYGGPAEDQLSGGEGDDIIEGEGGNDAMRGGRGSDTFVFRRGDGQDHLWWDYREEDRDNTGDDDAVYFPDLNADALRSVTLKCLPYLPGRFMELNYGTDDRLTIHLQQHRDPSLLVNHFRFADGESLTAGALLDKYLGPTGVLTEQDGDVRDQGWTVALQNFRASAVPGGELQSEMQAILLPTCNLGIGGSELRAYTGQGITEGNVPHPPIA